MSHVFYSMEYCSDSDCHGNEVYGNEVDMFMNPAPQVHCISKQRQQLCNKCFSVLQLRSGKFGDFLFCENQKTCGAKTISIK